MLSISCFLFLPTPAARGGNGGDGGDGGKGGDGMGGPSIAIFMGGGSIPVVNCNTFNIG